MSAHERRVARFAARRAKRRFAAWRAKRAAQRTDVLGDVARHRYRYRKGSRRMSARRKLLREACRINTIHCKYSAR